MVANGSRRKSLPRELVPQPAPSILSSLYSTVSTQFHDIYTTINSALSSRTKPNRLNRQAASGRVHKRLQTPRRKPPATDSPREIQRLRTVERKIQWLVDQQLTTFNGFATPLPNLQSPRNIPTDSLTMDSPSFNRLITSSESSLASTPVPASPVAPNFTPVRHTPTSPGLGMSGGSAIPATPLMPIHSMFEEMKSVKLKPVSLRKLSPAPPQKPDLQSCLLQELKTKFKNAADEDERSDDDTMEWDDTVSVTF